MSGGPCAPRRDGEGISAAARAWSRRKACVALAGFAAAMVVLIFVRHRTNIRRLLSGTENKIGHPGGAADGRQESGK